MSQLTELVLLIGSVPVLVVAAYLGLLTALSWRRATPGPALARLRFDVVVPAHDEQGGIGAVVKSLLALDYPSQLRRVIVIADNCSDRTAERARAAGAQVIERHDPAWRGKGHALATAFSRCLEDGFADAVVVVDADSTASPNLLRALSARLEAGAAAVQVHYGVRNPEASWRTRLMAIAFCLFHRVRSLGRERLRVSAGLRGNGMCFAVALLKEVPHDADSIVEDLDYGVRLGLAGHRVHYVDEASVLGEMPTTERGSRTQRRRWEGGRRTVARKYGAVLLEAAWRRRDPVLLDLALDVIVPPLTLVAAVAATGLASSAAWTWWSGEVTPGAVSWAACNVLLAAYVLRGVWLADMGLRGWLALAWVPAYAGWKLVLPVLGGRGQKGWVRTVREDAASTGDGSRQDGPLGHTEAEPPGMATGVPLLVALSEARPRIPLDTLAQGSSVPTGSGMIPPSSASSS